VVFFWGGGEVFSRILFSFSWGGYSHLAPLKDTADQILYRLVVNCVVVVVLSENVVEFEWERIDLTCQIHANARLVYDDLFVAVVALDYVELRFA